MLRALVRRLRHARRRLLSIRVYEKHDVVSFFLGKRSLLLLHLASCEQSWGEPGSAEARGAFGFVDLLGNVLP
jgi:hypothetical protein